MEIIAKIENDLKEKFGVPRQSGLAQHVISKIIFEPEYRDVNAFRGLEEYSHIWLIWEFSENTRECGAKKGDKSECENAAKAKSWSPTVRPPRLGGNQRVGVFATRSPFRPNPIGLSCVKLERIELDTPDGPVLFVSGADLMNDTPIFDIKPYLPYVDCYPDAEGSFSEKVKDYRLKIEMSCEIQKRLESKLVEHKINGLLEILAMDPRPSYHEDPERIYGVKYAGVDVKFQVKTDVLTIVDVSM